uniref:NAD-dependent epimerase/dehydratase domain-containing protein n=1 Tax=viral metagenome TaxID=1070528 RepID=A0A6C0C2P4_9ZZZZ
MTADCRPEARQRRALVIGAGGFIGHAMVKRLVDEGFWVRGVDRQHAAYESSHSNEFITADMRDPRIADRVLRFHGYEGCYYKEVPLHLTGVFDEVYQFAADMGGAGFVFTGDNDADILCNSALININVLNTLKQLNSEHKVSHTKVFFAGSACMYPEHNQMDPNNPVCSEDSAYPANPDSEYGWEKLFSERLYLAHSRNYGIPVRIARYHNIYGPGGTWEGGREKAPAAICRKIAKLESRQKMVEIWGDGQQTRSFLYIDDCIEATRRLVNSDFTGPVNIGSEEMVTINALTDMVADIACKGEIKIANIPGPEGVRGRTSHNALFVEKIGWGPTTTLREGMEKTYAWVELQLRASS